MKKILIVGDSGRGKTTLAQNLSKKIKIKTYHLDDIYWKYKFTKVRERKKSIRLLKKIISKKSWIVEGSVRYLIKPIISKSDVIIYLHHKNMLWQFFILFKRHIQRKDKRQQGNECG